ncbi:MAG TPA: HEAT repeat domain-containing protein [Chloroflexia bacterium]|nr:HEAT repeat domain-containing protein [Chloroflexia bacterium]
MAGETKHSTYWDSFYESFFGDPYMAWHDGLDTQSLAALRGEERDEAERLLTEALKRGDYRPAVGLRVLGSKGSVAQLKEQLGDADGKTEIEIALTLWKLAEWPPAVNILIRALKDGPHWSIRLDAARALGDVETPKSAQALLSGLNDPEDLVRCHCAESLIEMLDLPARANDIGSYELAIEVMGDKAKREKAIKQIQEMVGKTNMAAELRKL